MIRHPITAHSRFAGALALAALAAAVACSGNGKSPTAPSVNTPQSTPASPATVSSIAVTGNGSFAALGDTQQLTATATMSTGVTQNVTTTATWTSSNGAVASVSSTGMVIALGAGLANVRATFQSASSTLDIAVSPSSRATGLVRTLYVTPSDRPSRADYRAAIQNALIDLRGWFRGQLGGRTFELYSGQPETCQLRNPADYYSSDTWTKVFNDVQACAPVSYGATSIVWVLYVDVIHACNAPGRLGAGTLGVTMLPRQDMEGLIGEPYVDECGTVYRLPVGRYVGGLGHEMGHAFGLPHPPGCDQGAANCDSKALMWSGYASYPNTYVRDDEKAVLLRSTFF